MSTTHDTSAVQVPNPAPGILMTREYVHAVGRVAYIWAGRWSTGNRRIAFSKLPAPGLIGGVLPAAFNSVTMLAAGEKYAWSH